MDTDESAALESTVTEFAKQLLAPDGNAEEFASLLHETIQAEQKKLDGGVTPDEAAKAKSLLKAAASAKFILEFIPNFYKTE